MADTDESLLDTISIMDTRLGTVAFRRTLSRAGYKTFRQAFDASDAEIDRVLSLDDADELDKLRENYEKNPKGFLLKLVSSVEEHRSTRNKPTLAPEKSGKSNSAVRNSAPSIKRDAVPKILSEYPMPGNGLGKALIAHERMARIALDAISDRDDDYLVFESFDDYALQIDDMRVSMLNLFRQYGKNIVYLEKLIRANLPNLYLVFVADGAREKFKGKNLWGNLFEEAGIKNENQITKLKQLFMDCLEQRGMPTYAKGERDFYYLYTALLHGGLSKAAWDELWGRTLLPLAKQTVADPYGMGGRLNGTELLSMLREGEGAAARTKESVKNILGKIPDRTIAPIIESAFGVARRLADTGGEGVTMITSSGLPPAAIESLDNIVSMPVAGLVPKHHFATKERSRRIIPIQEGDLYLEMSRGVVLMRWRDQKLPEDYVGSIVEIYVDGTLKMKREVLQGIGTGILRSCEVEVSPSASYSVEIRLLKLNNEGNEKKFDEVGTLNQTFERVHSGCFEFLKNSEGLYRLRRKKDRIRRPRTVAFVVKEGRTIRPGNGMSAVENRQTAGVWERRTIRLFKVEPGASVAVCSESDGSVISAWHESFGTTIHRDNVIGFTDDGLDLYGVVTGEDGRNTTLPDILIDSADDKVAYDDLTVTCQCDGKELSIGLSSFGLPGDESMRFDGVRVRLADVPSFPTLASECVVDVRQRNTGCLVCRYRFSVIPITKFALSHLWMTGGESLQLTATYSFRVLEQVVITEEGRISRVSKRATYYLSRPLSYESAHIAFESCDHARNVSFTLGLAGIDVRFSEELGDIFLRGETISAAHAMDFTLDDELVVKTIGNRSSRGISLMYGDLPLLLGEEPRRSEHRFGLFSDPSIFAFNEHEESGVFTLRLAVSFGMRGEWGGSADARCSSVLLRFEKGLGLSEAWLDDGSLGETLVRFDRPAIIDMRAEFYADFSRSGRYRSSQTKRLTFNYDMSAGDDCIKVPKKVADDIKANRMVTVKLLPIDDFGEPDESYQMELSVREGKE